MTQETNGVLSQFGNQYLVAVYVKFVESAGARAAPILYPFDLTFVLCVVELEGSIFFLFKNEIYMTFASNSLFYQYDWLAPVTSALVIFTVAGLTEAHCKPFLSIKLS